MKTPNQTSFAEHAYANKKRQVRREKFRAEMERVGTVAVMVDNYRLEPHYLNAIFLEKGVLAG